MQKLHQIFCLISSVIIFASACDNSAEDAIDLDNMLEEALNNASGGQGTSFYQLPEPDDFDRIPQDPNNLLSEAKVELGKFLFHETALGNDPDFSKGLATYSCASCHHVDAGFASGVRQGIGEGGMGFGFMGENRSKDPEYPFQAMDVQPVKSPSVLNVAYQKNMLFNGQFGSTGENLGTEYAWLSNTPRNFNHLGLEGVETQAIASMETHRMTIGNFFVEEISAYKTLFDQAFPEVPEEERCNRINTGLAMAAYERTLLPTKAPFQEWLKGDKGALDQDSKEGAMLFFGKAGCYTCHNGPALNSMEFYALGMKDLYESGDEIINASRFNLENKGRGGFTEKGSDMFKFKVPQLYNLKDARFYGHGASFESLKAVVEYKNLAVSENINVPTGQLADEFVPLELTKEEINKIVAFLEKGLYDPDLQRYVPTTLPSGKCFPNSDPQSIIDLRCE